MPHGSATDGAQYCQTNSSFHVQMDVCLLPTLLCFSATNFIKWHNERVNFPAVGRENDHPKFKNPLNFKKFRLLGRESPGLDEGYSVLRKILFSNWSYDCIHLCPLYV